MLKAHVGHRAPVLDATLALNGSVVVSAGDEGVSMVFTTEAEEA